MDDITAQEAKDRLLDFIQAATFNNQQFRITSEEGNVILLPEETYQNILVTLEFLSTPGLLENIDFNSGAEGQGTLECVSHALNH